MPVPDVHPPGTNGKGEKRDQRLAIIDHAVRSDVYGRSRGPPPDDPLAQVINPFHAPQESATMANVTPQEGSALAYMRTIGGITKNPVILGYERAYGLYSRSRGGNGAEQVASVLRAGQGEQRKLSLRERIFGPKDVPQPQKQQ